MADLIITVLLAGAGMLALRACLRKRRTGGCPGGGCDACCHSCSKRNQHPPRA